MKFGINILNFGPNATPQVLTEWALRAESLGFDFVTISDHVVVTDDVATFYPEPFYETLTMVAYLAGITEKVELGTSVLVVPYRHPLLTARVVANIDQLSGGRMILGVGSGWAQQEFEALGIEFEHRGRLTDEYLQVIRRQWQTDIASDDGGSPPTNVHTAPHPRGQPRPPIWVGGNSLRAMRRAVLLGDAWHPIGTRAGWLESDGVPMLQQAAAKLGRDRPALAPRLCLEITKRDLPDTERLAGQGHPTQIRADLQSLQALGASHVLFDTNADDTYATTKGDHERHWRTMMRLSTEVLELAPRLHTPAAPLET